jgi:predicted nucleic acid-binding protein
MSGKLVDQLTRGSRVFLDSNALIYFVEEDARFMPLLRPVFERIDTGALPALSSVLTLLEVMVKPLRDGRPDIALAYREKLTTSRGFALHAIDQASAEKGADIRAEYSFSTPDSIQLATAQVNGATAFVTNDGQLRKYKEINVLVLKDWL